MRTSPVSRRSRLLTDERGQATLESALALSVVLLVLIGAAQLAVVHHARTVAQSAAVEGARHAAAEGRSAQAGAERTRQLLAAGLGATGEAFMVEAEVTAETVEVRAAGAYPLFIPWVTGSDVTVEARAEVRREGLRR